MALSLLVGHIRLSIVVDALGRFTFLVNASALDRWGHGTALFALTLHGARAALGLECSSIGISS